MNILVVEDNLGDARLIENAFAASPIPTQVSVVETGEQALAFVRQRGVYAQAPRPDVILLDLNLPGTDGREVLRELRADPALTEIPVVILTSSQSKTDVRQAVALGVERFLRKPTDLDTYIALVQDIAQWWGTPAGGPTAKQPLKASTADDEQSSSDE